MSRKESIKDLSSKGYNCAQAVSCAFTDVTSVSHQDWFKLAEGFGGGIGRMQGTCGALLAAYMIVSSNASDGALHNGKSKKDTYAKIQDVHYKFVERMGSSQCKELLLGQEPKPGKCDDKLYAACDVIEEALNKMGISC